MILRSYKNFNFVNSFKILGIIFFFLFFSNSFVYSQGLIFKDNFPSGKTELRWTFFPFFNLDNLEGFIDQDAPDGDNGVGILRNSNVGGFASLSYPVTKMVSNFYIETMIFCPISKSNKGPLSGIAFLIDPIKGSFYRFVCDFKETDPTLNVAYVGLDTRNYPVYLKFWDVKDLANEFPKESKWHKISINVKNGLGNFYWNGSLLPGQPIILDRNSKGFVGVYTNFVGGKGKAYTKIDAFLLKEE